MSDELEEELAEVYFRHTDGCADLECDGCQADFERVLAFVRQKLDDE